MADAPHMVFLGFGKYIRSDRIYESGDGWYCRTRERLPLGPFPGPEAAHRELAAYIS